MKLIFSIARNEVVRLRRQFSGSTNPLSVVILLAVLGGFVLALRQTTLLGNGLYRVGIWGDAPAIEDSRFVVTRISPEDASELLKMGALDVYVNGARVENSQTEKSLNALGALRRYLQKQEISRINQTESQDQAFPLRVRVNYLSRAVEATPAPATGAAVQLETATVQPQPTPAEEEVIIPSLMTPRAPFTEVVLCMVFILPVIFISIFFTSSFMEEKMNRRLTILLSTPITPFQIIMGKMMPYTLFSLAITALIALWIHANVLATLAIFTPTILFMFAIYLMVPLFYRTYKDTTFISMLVTTLTTTYLVFPAMFNGVSDFAYMSPLTLAIKMVRNEPFGWREYLFPSLPMVLIFALAVFAGTRLLNEEFLMGYRSLTLKIKDAIYQVMNREHPFWSIFFLSMMMIPVVYLVQLVILAISTNLPPNFMLVVMLLVAALAEEVVKSIGIVVWQERNVITKFWQGVALAFLSALGFLIGEKLLLLLSLSSISQSMLASTIFNSRLLLLPLLAHFVFTCVVIGLRGKLRVSYPLALVIATVLHSFYNWFLMQGM